MRKHLLVVVAVAASLSLVACGSSDNKGSSSSSNASSGSTSKAATAPAHLVNSGQFTACMDISFPPMEYYQSGSKTPSGFDVAVIKKVAESWGTKPVYRETQFDGLLPALAAGRCDVIWSGIFVTPEREKQFPVVRYYETGTVLLVQSGNPKGIHSPDDLAGKTLVAQTGTTLLDDAKKLSKELKGAVKVQAYPKATDLIQQLVVGRADAALTQDTEAGYRAKQNPGKFEVGYSYPDKLSFGVYYRKQAPEVGAAIKSALQKMDADGALKQIGDAEGVPPAGFAIG